VLPSSQLSMAVARRLKRAFRVLSRIYCWGRSSEWQKATSFLEGSGGMPPRKFFEMNIRWDAIWSSLRHNFETMFVILYVPCHIVSLDREYLLHVHWMHVASGWFLRYSYFYTVMMTIYFRGKLGILGASFYPSNTLDRTLGVIHWDERIHFWKYCMC